MKTKGIGKLVAMLLFVGLLCFGSSSAFASEILNDGQTLSEMAYGGQIFDINVGDDLDRTIFVSSTSPVRVMLYSVKNNHLEWYETNYDHYGVNISWNFLPNYDYKMLVFPENPNVLTRVTVSMEKKPDYTWLHVDNFSETKKLIPTGNYDDYAMKFATSGKYKVTVYGGPKLMTMVYDHGQPVNFGTGYIEGGQKEFIIDVESGDAYKDNTILLINQGPSGQYSIKIEKL